MMHQLVRLEQGDELHQLWFRQRRGPVRIVRTKSSMSEQGVKQKSTRAGETYIGSRSAINSCKQLCSTDGVRVVFVNTFNQGLDLLLRDCSIKQFL